MGEFGSVNEILQFAIAREVEANEFYTALADRVESPAMAELILEFAKEELEHKAKLELEVMKRGEVTPKLQAEAEKKKLDDFKMADYIADVGDSLDVDYEDLLLFAIKKEKISFRLYADLAGVVADEELHETLLSLAEEEAGHKARFEIEYNEEVLKQK